MDNHERDTAPFNFTKLAPKLKQINPLVDEEKLTEQGQLMHLAARNILAFVLEQITPALQNEAVSDETRRRAKGALIYAYSQLGHKRMRLKRQGLSPTPHASNGQNPPKLGFEEVYEEAYRALEKLEMLILDPLEDPLTSVMRHLSQPVRHTNPTPFMDVLAEARAENEILPGKFK